MQTTFNATICVNGNNYQSEDSMPENIRQAFSEWFRRVKGKAEPFRWPERAFYSEAREQDRL